MDTFLAEFANYSYFGNNSLFDSFYPSNLSQALLDGCDYAADTLNQLTSEDNSSSLFSTSSQSSSLSSSSSFNSLTSGDASGLTSETFCTNLNTTVNDNCKDPSYYAISYRIIGTIFQGFILIVGVLGNIMVVIVVVRTKSMKTPTNCYLVSLSIADLMVLMAAVPNEIIAYYVLGDQWIWGRIGCALFIFLQYLGIDASSLSITAFTIERYIAICHPMKAQKVCTVHRAKRIILGVWAFAFLYCSPWLFLTKTEPICYRSLEKSNLETCTFALSRKYYLGYFFSDLLLFYVIPLLLSCVLYGLMARILFNNPMSKTMSSSSSPANNTVAQSAHSKKNLTQSNDSARVQVVKMLVVIVAVFATLWLPYRALLVYNSMAEVRYMELWYLMFCKTMIFVNSAINPILYNALSIKFRRAFKRMLSCESRKRRRNIEAPLTSIHVSTGNSIRTTGNNNNNNNTSNNTNNNAGNNGNNNTLTVRTGVSGSSPSGPRTLRFMVQRSSDNCKHAVEAL